MHATESKVGFKVMTQHKASRIGSISNQSWSRAKAQEVSSRHLNHVSQGIQETLFISRKKYPDSLIAETPAPERQEHR